MAGTLSAFSIQLSAFSDQLTVGYDLRDHASTGALRGHQLLNGRMRLIAES
jgi:hypothetical protein